MSSASTSEERDTRKKDFIDIAVTSAAFRMDIDEKAEAYSLLQLLKKSNTHPKISQYLADIAISL